MLYYNCFIYLNFLLDDSFDNFIFDNFANNYTGDTIFSSCDKFLIILLFEIFIFMSRNISIY